MKTALIYETKEGKRLTVSAWSKAPVVKGFRDTQFLWDPIEHEFILIGQIRGSASGSVHKEIVRLTARESVAVLKGEVLVLPRPDLVEAP